MQTELIHSNNQSAMRKVIRSCFALGLIIGITACGQKGPLKEPEDEQKPAAQEAVPLRQS